MKILMFAALALAGAAAAGVVAQAGSKATTTTVRVTEREYKLSLSATALHPGATRFEIKNTGKLSHAFAIAGQGLTAKTKLIKPGKSAVLSVGLTDGAYGVWCPVRTDAAKGMKATLRVAGPATQGGGAGGGDATTAPGDTGTGPGVPWG